jgi:formate dehydrogenase major subunit
VKDGELINLEGDPDHPINRGALCSKGSAQFNVRNVYDPETGELRLNPYRVTKVKYRAPGASDWEEKDWEWAMAEIAKRVKATRDATYETTDENGVTVNRTRAIGNLGGAALDDEECYVIQKLARAIGVTYIEHQARI